MSEFSNDLSRVFVPSNDFNPGHQLPGQSFALQQQPQTSNSASSAQDIVRMQQLDAGVMQTLNLQAKLAIGVPGDKYEQEADQVAAQVVERINSPQAQQKPIQREEIPKEDEELKMKPLAQTIQRQDMPEEEEELKMQPLGQQQSASGNVASANLESSIESARGQGYPLEDGVRGSMEQSFGVDFSGVRVHTDTQSDQLNQSIQARAFTTGQDIFFRGGAYQPGNRDGQALLAHELTHVVQQNGSAVQQKK